MGLLDADVDAVHVLLPAGQHIEAAAYDLTKADVEVTRKVAGRAQAKGVKRFIYTGSIDSYYLIRHPNRRRPTYRDWDSRSHRARYDNSKAKQVLGLHPAATREALIEHGVVEAVRDSIR